MTAPARTTPGVDLNRNAIWERSTAARRRMIETPGDPLFLAGWKRALFLHYEVDPALLQEVVPFELDLRNGRAYVSLVAFTIEAMRPYLGGKWSRWLLAPIATHNFLNVRTYVRNGDEKGIFFLREWLSNRLSVHLGPPAFGLPYRYGKTTYDHRLEAGILSGEVLADDLALRYHGKPAEDNLHPVVEGSLEEFLLERYTAFTALGPDKPRRHFHVWHEPWLQLPAEITIEDDALIRNLGPWASNARFIGATYSPGVDDVWMGWPRKV